MIQVFLKNKVDKTFLRGHQDATTTVTSRDHIEKRFRFLPLGCLNPPKPTSNEFNRIFVTHNNETFKCVNLVMGVEPNQAEVLNRTIIDTYWVDPILEWLFQNSFKYKEIPFVISTDGSLSTIANVISQIKYMIKYTVTEVVNNITELGRILSGYNILIAKNNYFHSNAFGGEAILGSLLQYVEKDTNEDQLSLQLQYPDHYIIADFTMEKLEDFNENFEIRFEPT